MAQYNSFFRVPMLVLRQRLRPLPRINLLATESLRMRVWPTDIDFNRHMNNSRYLLYMDYARVHLLASTGMLDLALNRRWVPLIGGVDITFRRSLEVFDRFTLTSRNLCWDEKWFYAEQRFTFAGGLAAVASVKALLRDGGSNVPPQTVADLLEPGLVSPPVAEELTQWNAITREKLR